MAEESTLDIVTAYQNAWTRQDFDAAARYIADDVVFVTPRQRLQGIDQFMQMIRAFSQRIEPRWELVASTQAENSVLLLYRIFTTGGSPALCADFFTVASGRIATEMLTFDPAPFV